SVYRNHQSERQRIVNECGIGLEGLCQAHACDVRFQGLLSPAVCGVFGILVCGRTRAKTAIVKSNYERETKCRPIGLRLNPRCKSTMNAWWSRNGASRLARRQ